MGKRRVDEIEQKYQKPIDEVTKELDNRSLDLEELNDLIEGDYARLLIKYYGKW